MILRTLDVISPVYNEESSISYFLDEVNEVVGQIDIPVRLILVNDGSTDSSSRNVREWYKSKATVNFSLTKLNLSRNFGHQNAVLAGLEQVPESSHLIVLDSDLQDSPTHILDILQEFRNGADVVLMQRSSRNDSFTKKLFASTFYRILSRISESDVIINSGDYYGLSPRAKNAVLSYRDHITYLRGTIQSIGFKREVILYARNERVAGTTHYTITKMLRLAIAGITGFSVAPILASMYLLLLCMFTALISLLVSLHQGNKEIASWQMYLLLLPIALSVLVNQLYLARLSLEGRKRPNYILESTEYFKPKKSREKRLK